MMKEPTTVKEAVDLTLRKILECMDLPIGERRCYWHGIDDDIEADWVGDNNLFPFCSLRDKEFNNCPTCPNREPCTYFLSKAVLRGFGNRNKMFYKNILRKLYRMVEAIEC